MLSNTACVILGLLQKQPMSGYDIKGHVDISTRFFFPSSYSQIYPELKRLEAEKLVAGTELANGRRPRTEYAITPAGQAAFNSWIQEPGAGLEIRDEGLLKFFFAGGLDRDLLLEKLAAIRAERAIQLRQIKAVGEDVPEIADELQLATLDFGVGLYEYVIGWCDQFSDQVSDRPATDFPIGRVSVK
ncbi:MAG: PadR family transcriptional regulator [Thermoleophilaceae bacterium]|nr:PadR family transcriptional regulator [Thermoleophilaceae bacterium]